MRDAERRLEKREDLLDQKLDLINKKEREVESIQRFLGDQQEELNKRNAESKSVLAEQREALHRLSGLSREDAREQLLRRLENDLAHEVGGLIIKHEQDLKETCGQKAREILAST
ncbi:MAG TPA: Rnase Y domain-containing protein, partial [Isosphaeraceae bacterium]